MKNIIFIFFIIMYSQAFSQSWKGFYNFENNKKLKYHIEITDLKNKRILKTELIEKCINFNKGIYTIELYLNKNKYIIKLDKYGNCKYQSNSFSHLFLVLPKYSISNRRSYYFKIKVSDKNILCKADYLGNKISGKDQYAEFKYIGKNENEKISARISFDTNRRILYFVDVFYYNLEKGLKLHITKKLL